jgi:hypothetical protein
MRSPTRCRQQSLLRLTCAVGCALAACAWLEADASAEVKLGIEPRAEVMFRGDGDVHAGPGLQLDVGYAFDTFPIIVVPELAIAGALYAPGPLEGSFRTTAGIRVGASLEVEPSVYVRGGYCLMVGRSEPDHAGTLEAGLSLDKRFQREITFGGSVGYQGIYYKDSLNGVVGGVHVGFWL